VSSRCWCLSTPGLIAPADLLLSSFNNGLVLRFNENTGQYIDTFIPNTNGLLNLPHGLGLRAGRKLYVASAGNGSMLRYNGTNGTYLGAIVVSTGSGLSLPIGFEFGPGGDLFVASYSNGRVARFNGVSGARMGDFVSVGATGLSGPNFMLFHDLAPPRINAIQRVGTNVIVSWSARSDTQLQSKTNLNGTNWQNVAGTLGRSLATNSGNTNAVFFRLIRD